MDRERHRQTNRQTQKEYTQKDRQNCLTYEIGKNLIQQVSSFFSVSNIRVQTDAAEVILIFVRSVEIFTVK